MLGLMVGIVRGVALVPLSDPLPITHWGVDVGLLPGAATSILQTRDGYLWFGSEEGLTRFDGVQATTFDAGNTPEMKINTVETLFEDQRGRLWIGLWGSGGGVMCRTAEGEFTRYSKADGLDNELVLSFAEDDTGQLWVGTDGGGLFKFRGGRFYAFAGNTSLPDQSVVALVPAAEGGLWVGSRDQLARIHDGVVHTNVATEGLPPDDTVALLPDPAGGLWIGGKRGLYRLENGKFTHIKTPGLPGCCVESLCFGVDGRLWIGAVDGLYRLENGRAYRTSMEQGLSGNIVHAILRDREGSIWLGTEAPGVDQIRFSRFAVLSTRQGMSHSTTTSVFEDDTGALWIGSARGINCYSNGVVSHWSERDGLPDNLVFTSCADGNGNLWLGTFHGLCRFENGRFRLFDRSDGLKSSVFWCLYRARDGTVWGGSRSGLARFTDHGFEFLRNKNSGLSHDDVRCIAEDAAGTLWVGTSCGLNRWDGVKFERFYEAAPNRPFNAVIALHSDRNGDLWIGTMEQGLVLYRHGKFTSFGKAEGLHDNLVYVILEDDDDNLWMSCNRGIFRVAKADLYAVAEGLAQQVSCKVFGKADGLLTTECNGTVQPAGCRTRDGRLWFATTDGLAVVDPANLPPQRPAPPVQISAVLLDDTEVKGESILNISPSVEELQIKYTAPSFIAPGMVRFKYRLIGLDRDWRAATAERIAHYTHLPAGNYRFEVLAGSVDGVWGEHPAEVAMVIAPPWWQTVWFVTIATIAFVGLVGGGARLVTVRRYRLRMAELARQHALEQERSRIARDMHDVLGAELVKISMLGEMAETEADAPQTLRPRLQKIVTTARNAVRGMDEIVWAVNPKNDSLENLANYLCQFAREHFETTEIRLHLDVPPDLPELPLSTEIRHDLFLVVKEALNNVVKHSCASDVWLLVHSSETKFIITIKDNGRGIMPNGNGRLGNGMGNMQSRMSQHGGTFQVASADGSGTEIRVALSLRSPGRRK